MPPKYPDFTRQLLDQGWSLKSQEGAINSGFTRQSPGKVTVAGHPNDDIPIGTYRKMKKQAGFK